MKTCGNCSSYSPVVTIHTDTSVDRYGSCNARMARITVPMSVEVTITIRPVDPGLPAEKCPMWQKVGA